jgi:hypothetical protein
LRERNQRIRNRSTPTMFLFFYCFMYTFLSTVVISQEIKFITDKTKLCFWFSFFFGSRFYTFALTVFPYSFLTKNYLSILTLSHFLILTIKDAYFYHPYMYMCSTLYRGTNPSCTNTNFSLFYSQTYDATLQPNIGPLSSICL